MDNKSCNSSGGEGGDSTATSSNSNSAGNRDMYLKHLNKISHKISKPIRNNKPPLFDNPHAPPQNQHVPPPLPPQPQQQPPVYNINKSDFRDVVQKLTGSPAHERISTPPPIQQPKAPSSRLQRIRPPPLAQITNRPPPFVNNNAVNNNSVQPLSPLPPFPSVHASAESPISAYMRFLQTSAGLSPLAPRWNNFVHAPPQQPPFPPPQQHQQNIPPPPQTAPFPSFPSSPLPFGCLPSPKSPYGLLSPSLLLSPSGQLGFQQLPLSPTLPVASPKWKGI
ncbi:VQ motif-containing protein 9 [Lycium barbarum]|uniref:VQ motif-containing protein 9 n=1 Tax=Lycium barbarum TaxID=112863 RepID=UPI00293F2DF0|nr:VQ motif-containing protein 9 [Lycium barbarum]